MIKYNLYDGFSSFMLMIYGTISALVPIRYLSSKRYFKLLSATVFSFQKYKKILQLYNNRILITSKVVMVWINHLSSVRVNEVHDLSDLLFEDPIGARVGHHEGA